MKLNLPNILTISRVFITVFFLFIIMMDFLPHKFLIACVVFILGSITDALDGYLARKNNQITNFGKFLDPVADKILTTSALLAFLSMELCNVWIIMIILIREFAISSVRMVAATNGVVIPANIWGKIKTATQMVFTILIMILGEFYYILEQTGNNLLTKLPDLALISNILLWITTFFTVVSGIVYLQDSKKIIDFTK